VKKLALKSFIVLVLIVLTTILLVDLDKIGADNYYSAVVFKHKMLKETDSPRIVLVGGSNVAMGINSEKIHEHFGLPVINLGTAAGYGLNFMIEMTSKNVKPNDIIIMIPEYYQFYYYYNGGEALTVLLEVFPQSIKYLSSPKQYINIVKSYPSYLQLKFNDIVLKLVGKKNGSRFNAPAKYNEYGDYLFHLNLKPKDISNQYLYDRSKLTDFDQFQAAAIEALNQLDEKVRANGGIAAFIFPPIPEKRYQEEKIFIEYVYKRLEKELTMPMFDGPSDQVYPLNYFFDSPYHMNKIGREARTKRLIKDLERGLKTIPHWAEIKRLCKDDKN